MASRGRRKRWPSIAGHHSIYKGKLGLIDRAQGLQAGKGIEFVNTKLNGDSRTRVGRLHPARAA